MHKNQPGKSVKTKRNKEINYFANIISCLVTQKRQKLPESVKLMAHSTNFHSDRTWKIRSDRQTEGRKISIFNILD